MHVRWDVREALDSADELINSDNRDCAIYYNCPKVQTKMFHCNKIFKRPARDACLCMGEFQAPPALPAPPAPHFVFLITL